MPALALLLHLIDGVDAGVAGPVSGMAAERAAAWCQYLEAHARRLYATVTYRVRVAAALLASRMARGGLASPFEVGPEDVPRILVVVNEQDVNAGEVWAGGQRRGLSNILLRHRGAAVGGQDGLLAYTARHRGRGNDLLEPAIFLFELVHASQFEHKRLEGISCYCGPADP
jgi:hypothetical protein